MQEINTRPKVRPCPGATAETVTMVWTPETARKYLIDRGFDPNCGARFGWPKFEATGNITFNQSAVLVK